MTKSFKDRKTQKLTKPSEKVKKILKIYHFRNITNFFSIDTN